MPSGVAKNRTVPFGIGSDKFAGFSKLIEEQGETLQELGKIIGANSMGEHWDGKGDLRTRLENEIADTQAAQIFVIQENGLRIDRIQKRAESKLAKFYKWHYNIQNGRDPNDDG